MDVGSLKKVIGADAWCFVSQKSHHNCALKTLICQEVPKPNASNTGVSNDF